MTSTDDFQKFEAFCKKYNVPEVAADLKEAFIVFRQIDKNKDGSLDMKEIKKLGLSEKSNEEIIAKGGPDRKITLAELIKFIFLPNVEEKWQKIFDEFKTNNTIGPDEMEAYLKKCGFEKTNVKSAIEVIETYDTNEDKRLSFNEFLKYITHDFDALVEKLWDSTFLFSLRRAADMRKKSVWLWSSSLSDVLLLLWWFTVWHCSFGACRPGYKEVSSF
ncbi:uncharacterized protein LOC141906295 [Tubulanus polymorphus]|uniref:uncharacterized protein LOC141906295 n=1 Tax=Tubulanus polymorphus TaxID=672921 RepID=UPI003DA5EDDD